MHHVRKAGADDFLQEVSGTNGLAGAADATLVLKRARGEADAVLCITGRDVEEAEHALTFQPDTGTWLMLDGPAGNHTLPPTRAAILRHLKAHQGQTPRAIADATGQPHDTTKKTCQRMAADGQLTTDGTGHYYAPMPSGPPATTGVPAVPAVPAVPEPLFPQVNAINERGHPGAAGVPAVPAPPTNEGVVQ